MKVIDLNQNSSSYHTIKEFSLGEKKIYPQNLEVGDSIFIIQRIAKTEKVGDKIFDLLLFLNCLPQNCNIYLFLPYLYNSRQDKFKNSALDFFLTSLSQNQVKVLFTFDIHNTDTAKKSPVKIINLSIADLLQKDDFNSHAIIISPDHGGLERAKYLSQILKLEYLYLEKIRNNSSISYHLEQNILLNYDKAIIFDDIIDSGNTMLSAINDITSLGIKEIDIINTHYLCREDIKFPRIVKRIFSTNSIIDPLIEKAVISEDIIFNYIDLMKIYPNLIEFYINQSLQLEI